MLIFGAAEIIFGLVYAISFITAIIVVYHLNRFGIKWDFFGHSMVMIFMVITLFLAVVNGTRMFAFRSYSISNLLPSFVPHGNLFPNSSPSSQLLNPPQFQIK